MPRSHQGCATEGERPETTIRNSAGWSDYTEARLSTVTSRLKRRRVEWFVRACGLGPRDVILDLGSEDGTCLASVYPYPQNIVLADIAEDPMREGVRRFGLKEYVVIPPEGPLPFSDGAFRAVWCNSVIEHVTVPRVELGVLPDREFSRRADAHQRAFAAEIARIGRQYFVQTPYRHFPIEAHAWLPFVQYLPQEARWRASRLLAPIWVKKWKPDFLLYDRDRFANHFPGATIATERVLGVPKALIAIRA